MLHITREKFKHCPFLSFEFFAMLSVDRLWRKILGHLSFYFLEFLQAKTCWEHAVFWRLRCSSCDRFYNKLLQTSSYKFYNLKIMKNLSCLISSRSLMTGVLLNAQIFRLQNPAMRKTQKGRRTRCTITWINPPPGFSLTQLNFTFCQSVLSFWLT